VEGRRLNFLADYDKFTSGNEANRNYHMWTALAVLSTLVSRKVWIDLGYFKVYPNLYLVLLGPAGNKKTTAMSLGKKMVLRLDETLVSADCQSAQDTVKMLADTGLKILKTKDGLYEYSPITVFATELSQFVEIDPARMIDLWVTIYDCDPYTKKTLRHGGQTIINPFFTILGCTVPDWITRHLKSDIITSGFARRCIFVLEDYSERRVPFPLITPEMKFAYDSCIKRGAELMRLYGCFSWDPAAKAHYEKWYMTREIKTDPDIGSFDRTKYIQILKVAMLLGVAQSDDLVMTIELFELARSMIDAIIVNLPAVFRAVGRNQLADVSSKMISMLTASGGFMRYNDVMTALWKDANSGELYQVLSHLTSIGQIRRVAIGGIDHVITETKFREIEAAKTVAPQQSQTPPVET